MWYYNWAPKKSAKRTLKIKQRQTNKDPTILKRNRERSQDTLRSIYGQKLNASALKNELRAYLKDFNARALRYNNLESLILAQDERWRRA